MKKFYVSSLLVAVALVASSGAASPANEYDKHFAPLTQLSVAVAQAMPAESYSFRPHPESMTFGELMMHIASTTMLSAPV